ncbi:hypothetical protein Tco_0949256 [Tanacetum coccineum]
MSDYLCFMCHTEVNASGNPPNYDEEGFLVKEPVANFERHLVKLKYAHVMYVLVDSYANNVEDATWKVYGD